VSLHEASKQQKRAKKHIFLNIIVAIKGNLLKEAVPK
jgi:hypothetical protein